MKQAIAIVIYLSILGQSKAQSLNTSPDSPSVSVEVRGREVFLSKKEQYRIKRTPTANELYYFLRALGAFNLKKGLINIVRKSNTGPETIIPFTVCKLIADGKGETTIALKDGDILEAYEPEY